MVIDHRQYHEEICRCCCCCCCCCSSLLEGKPYCVVLLNRGNEEMRLKLTVIFQDLRFAANDAQTSWPCRYATRMSIWMTRFHAPEALRSHRAAWRSIRLALRRLRNA